MKLATLTGRGWRSGTGRRGTCPARARLSGESFEDVAALPADLAAGHEVRRMAHQRVGEGRLAGAVGAHDRVDLTGAEVEVDALEDLVLGLGAGATWRSADDEVAGRSRRWWTPTGRLRRRPGGRCWPWLATCRSQGDRSRRGHEVGEGHAFEGAGDRVPDADPEEVDGAASRCGRRPRRDRVASLAQIIGAIGPSRARRTSLIRISSGGRASS